MTQRDRYARLTDHEIWERIIGNDSPAGYDALDVAIYLADAPHCADLNETERWTVAKALIRYAERANP